jgi:GntR family transcriptional repressor for pyruvate dehydrogenase complex
MATAAKPAPGVLRRQKLYTQVASTLERWILNELKTGDKLPSEPRLAAMFHVGRSSIRDAVRKLETVGLLECRHGVGTIVRDVSGESVLDPLAAALLLKRHHIHDLLEVRQMIEPGIAARAAVHASPEQIARLELILRRQQENLGDGGLPGEDDIAFHCVIATAADNSVMLKIFDLLMEQLKESRERSLQVKGRSQKSYAGHRRILEALKRKDAGGAETAMRRHLQEIEKIILRGLRQENRERQAGAGIASEV